MPFKQKPINEQVIVITGASSGIGLVTSRMAAKLGARLVLVARNEDAVRKLASEINAAGGDAQFAPADVGREEDLRNAADKAVFHYGHFDTWINNAGVSIYGNLVEVSEADSRRLFDTNFWGVVNGSLVAANHLRTGGGTIINIGSTLSDRAIPVQGMYCASKHAVKGFTDALRMELEADSAPVLVTLVKPSAIDTPYKDHAKNYLGVRPENPPPVYAPEIVAETILYCASNPVRGIFVGGGGKAIAALGEYAPRLTDRLMENTMIDLQKTDEPIDGNPTDALYQQGDASLTERGGYAGHIVESSVYTRAALHPVVTGAAIAAGIGAGIGAAYLINRSVRGANTHDDASGSGVQGDAPTPAST
jgi:short-subunit dehydrogenase